VLKKIFKAVTASILLWGCYLGYVRAFAVVVEQLRTTRRIDKNAFVRSDSKSKREAIDLARTHLGRNHWSADEELTFRYYNCEQGFWMYAKEVVRVVEQDGVRYDGKRVTMAPFALIWLSADGKSAKTVLSDRAVFDLNEPLSLNVNPSGNALKIKHAWIQENVLIRDNHGTPDPSDDMNIGPLTAVEYDEPTLQIRSESDVVIQDRDIRVTGVGMKIQLRAKDELAGSGPGHSSAGFQGAETLFLHKKVHVVMRDVGKSGILPGSVQTKRVAPAEVRAEAKIASRPDQKTATPAAPDEPTPMEVWCDSTMRVDLPKPQTPVLIGPPEPPAPTLVKFERNVVVLRGPVDSLRDQLTCDSLKLTMVPGQKTPKSDPGAKPKSEPPAQPNANEDSSAFGGLTLQSAYATGHAVWLDLPAHGVKLRCNELIHHRLMPYKPDMTYFRGDPARPIELWKTDAVREEGPDQGKVTSVTYIRTLDATMNDKGTGLDTANVIARGPGIMETRPDRNQPVERIAIWQDVLHVENKLGPDGQVKQKIIVLSGSRPCFIDAPKKTSLDSASTIWVWLKPKPAAARDAGSPAAAPAGFVGTGASAATPIVMASSRAIAPPVSSAGTQSSTGDDRGAKADPGGGGFQIDRLVALRDVHLLAPSKTMTARARLDADFVDAVPTPVASAPTTKAESTPNSSPANVDAPQAQSQAQVQEAGSTPSSEPVVAQKPEETQPTDPPMTASPNESGPRLSSLQDRPNGPQRPKQAPPRRRRPRPPPPNPMPKCVRFGCGATSPCAKSPRPARPRGKRPPAKPSISTTAVRTSCTAGSIKGTRAKRRRGPARSHAPESRTMTTRSPSRA